MDKDMIPVFTSAHRTSLCCDSSVVEGMDIVAFGTVHHGVCAKCRKHAQFVTEEANCPACKER